MEARVAQLERRLSQVESSLSTAIQALTELMRGGRRSQPLQDAHLEGQEVARTRTDSARVVGASSSRSLHDGRRQPSRSSSRADMEESVEGDMDGVLHRLTVMEQHMKAVLAYIRDKEKAAERRAAPACDPPTPPDGSVLEARVHRQPSPPFAPPQLQQQHQQEGDAANQEDGEPEATRESTASASEAMEAAAEATLPPPLAQIATLVDERVAAALASAQKQKVIHHGISSDRSEESQRVEESAVRAAERRADAVARDIARHTVGQALTEAREAAALERRSAFAALKRETLQEIVDLIAKKGKPDDAGRAPTTEGARARQQTESDEERVGLDAEETHSKPERAPNKAADERVYAELARAVAREEAVKAIHASREAAAVEQKNSVASAFHALEDDLRRWRDKGRELQQQQQQTVAGLSPAVATLESRVGELAAQVALVSAEQEATAQMMCNIAEKQQQQQLLMASTASESIAPRPTRLARGGNGVLAASEAPQRQEEEEDTLLAARCRAEMAGLLVQLRRELKERARKELEGAALGFARQLETQTAAQDAALRQLAEDQECLRAAVRTLVTPSTMLQGLDQRLRVLRQEVTTLQTQQGHAARNSHRKSQHTRERERARDRDRRPSASVSPVTRQSRHVAGHERTRRKSTAPVEVFSSSSSSSSSSSAASALVTSVTEASLRSSSSRRSGDEGHGSSAHDPRPTARLDDRRARLRGSDHAHRRPHAVARGSVSGDAVENSRHGDGRPPHRTESPPAQAMRVASTRPSPAPPVRHATTPPSDRVCTLPSNAVAVATAPLPSAASAAPSPNVSLENALKGPVALRG